MKLSNQGLASIIHWEGMTPTPYLDDYPGGTWTIGIGITQHDGYNVKARLNQPGLSIEEMMDLFRKRIGKYEDGVNKAITRDIDQNQFDALVSFHYNTGAIAKATLTKLVNMGAPDIEVIDSLNQWTRSNGHTMKGLVKRRDSEGRIYSAGIYPPSTCTYVEANNRGKQIWSTAKEINLTPYL